MAIDKLKLVGGIKILTLAVYLIYFIISNTNPGILVKIGHKPEIELKRELLSTKCLLLLGGSNVRMGLSAEIISIKSCEALNLGVNSEAGGFQKYLNWLNHNAFADKVIYSSALIWQDSPLIDNNREGVIKFPNVALFSIIKIIFLPIENAVTPEFNKFGDEIKYQCLSNFPSFSVKINGFINSSYLINREIYNRISSLKEITNSDEILVRVPPVYVKTKRQAELYMKLMDRRIEILKGLGVKIVGTTLVSTDSSLFCDAFHPNAKGREVFSKEIKLP
jgi:hypothetical protein